MVPRISRRCAAFLPIAFVHLWANIGVALAMDDKLALHNSDERYSFLEKEGDHTEHQDIPHELVVKTKYLNKLQYIL